MKTPVAITWGALLVVSYTVVVPTLVTLLRQSLQAAQQIESYTAGILVHAGGIERNTAHAAALKATIALAPALASTAGSLQNHSGAIAAALGDAATPDQAAQNPAAETDGGPAGDAAADASSDAEVRQ